MVGATNVGFPASMLLAQIATANRFEAYKTALVDSDTVSVKDICKGFGANRVGKYKVEAIVESIEEQYGTKTACSSRSYVAAAQSVPGLIRESDVVFNGTDSILDAALVSEEARNALEIRMSTSMFGQDGISEKWAL